LPIDEIRKLGRQGHTVVAADTFPSAPGNHSKYASRACLTPSPRHEPARYVSEVASIVAAEGIDLIVPSFEEVFYMAREEERLPASARFFPSFEVLAMLHDKVSFVRFAESVGLTVPRSIVVRSREELEAAVAMFPRYFVKPVFSLGGVDLYTNSGKLAGASDLSNFAPTKWRPAVVQEYVEGEDVCSFSVVQHGRITAHSTYVHPREIEHSGGIVFESIDAPECVQIAQRIASATQYHGQLSFDLMRRPDGEMVLIECNPRPTAGVHVMPEDMFVEGLLDTAGKELRVAPAGMRRKYVVALLRDMVLHFKEAREDAKHLMSDAKEVVGDPDDLMPAIYQVLSYSRVIAYRKQLKVKTKRPTDLKAAYFEDVCWNAEEIEEASASVRASAEVQAAAAY